MPAILLAETQRVGERGEHLGGRSAIASLFQAHEVVDADAGEGGELGAPQSGGPAARSDRQSHIGGTDRFPTTAKEATQIALDHERKSASSVDRLPGPGRASLSAAFPAGGRSRIVAA